MSDIPEIDIRKLTREIIEIARSGYLPDGDSVNVSTRLWAESWWERIDKAQYEAWLKQ